jgi:CubicO group peptidase (beta-lactamase class C family)
LNIRIHTAPVEVTPAEAGFSEIALERLDDLLASLVKGQRLQCASYLLSREGKTFAHKSMGALQHTKGSADLKPDSIRRIASITKWFTLVALLRLVEEGKLYLTQPVKEWLEEFNPSPYDKITVYHLLTHTSGLTADPGYFTEAYPMGWWEYEFAFDEQDEDKRKSWTAEEAGKHRKSQWIKAMLAGPIISEPGTQWNYSSAGFALLGEIISRITGVSYDEYVHKTIIEPLELTRSFFEVPVELHQEVCLINDWDAERLTNRENRTNLPPRAGGGLYSTLSDIHRLGQMILNEGTLEGKRIISRKSIELIKRDQFPKGLPAFNWGARDTDFHVGLSSFFSRVGEPSYPTTITHEGAGRSALIVDDEERLVVSLFVPTAIEWVPESLINVKNIIWSGLR